MVGTACEEPFSVKLNSKAGHPPFRPGFGGHRGPHYFDIRNSIFSIRYSLF
jgi:hypothetical protein